MVDRHGARRLGWIAGLLSIAGSALAGGDHGHAANPARFHDLGSRISSIISTAKLGNAQVGVSIIDLSTGKTLFEQNAQTPLIPASNQKLLTTGTALSVLGPDYVFKTELLLDGERLILRGSGDPALGDPVILGRMQPKMTIDTLVGTLAQSLPRAGVRSISEIIVDDRVFDRQWTHPTWPADQLDSWYCAQVAGLNFHANVLSFFPQPARSGEGALPTLPIEPAAPWLEIENRARTTTGGKNSVWIRRDPPTGRFIVSGEVGGSTREGIEVTLNEVPSFAGQVLACDLSKAGVSIAGVAPSQDGKGPASRADLDRMLHAVRLAEAGESLQGKTVAIVTTTLKDIVTRCNTDSQNLYAESLCKAVGHEVTHEPGSWTNGPSVVRMTLSQVLGAEAASSTVVVDGSGMSRDNRVSPRTLTRWLEKMQASPKFAETFVDSLAEQGSGTLRKRFADAKLTSALRAKSGLLRQVRCLSGYVTGSDGHRVAFSIMLNDLARGQGELDGKEFTEDVVVAIDRWLAGQREGQ
jgi:D-alanyl-D-alanine carboxypeptidase/D-alanyl-D-alanine-endopeptidase (penicillin-binding protein 4)